MSKDTARLSRLIRNRSVRSAFQAADKSYGDEGMAGLKPKLGAYSGGNMPSVLSIEYPILFTFAQNFFVSKIRIEQGVGFDRDRLAVEINARPFARWRLDPRDFGFGDITEFDVGVALANEDAWPCRRR